jgi:hypothetical protein
LASFRCVCPSLGQSTLAASLPDAFRSSQVRSVLARICTYFEPSAAMVRWHFPGSAAASPANASDRATISIVAPG